MTLPQISIPTVQWWKQCVRACVCACLSIGWINELVHNPSLSLTFSVTGKQITDLSSLRWSEGLRQMTDRLKASIPWHCSVFYIYVSLLCDCVRLCIIEHFEPLSQYASNESSAPTSKWLFLNKPCLIDCVPPRHSPSGGCCVTASLKLQISICHSGSSAASGLMGVLVKATSLQNKAIKMLRKLDALFWHSHVRHLIAVLVKPPDNWIHWDRGTQNQVNVKSSR